MTTLLHIHVSRSARAIAGAAIVLTGWLGANDAAYAQPSNSVYPAVAPIEQYMSSMADEIMLARSAAPPSITADATVLVLGSRGYETAVRGGNGFVCFVQRSWAAGFTDPEFWNPKIRAANCFNPAAVRTELPQYLKRTEWVLAGASKDELMAKTRAAISDHVFQDPEPGALSFMLSKNGYLNDDAGGPWLPHVMLFVAYGQAAAWGAGMEGSPILSSGGTQIESTVLVIPVRRWSDGSAASPPPEQPVHNH